MAEPGWDMRAVIGEAGGMDRDDQVGTRPRATVEEEVRGEAAQGPGVVDFARSASSDLHS